MSKFSLEVQQGTTADDGRSTGDHNVRVRSEIAKQDPKLEAAVKTGFDNAARSAEVLAMKEGGRAKGEEASEVLQIIDELRDITFPGGKKG